MLVPAITRPSASHCNRVPYNQASETYSLVHPAQAPCGLWLQDLEGVVLKDHAGQPRPAAGTAVTSVGQVDCLLLQQADDCAQMWLQNLLVDELEDDADADVGHRIAEFMLGEVGRGHCWPSLVWLQPQGWPCTAHRPGGG